MGSSREDNLSSVWWYLVLQGHAIVQMYKSALTLLSANVETVPSMRRYSYPKASELSYSTTSCCPPFPVYPLSLSSYQ